MKSLSATVLALRDPLDTYVQAKAALDEAQRRFHAAQNALESYRKALGDNGQGTGDDTLLQTLTEEVVQRRATRQEVAQRREDAANRVRTLLAEAAAEEGIGESPREEPPVSTEPAESTTEKPVEAAEAAPTAHPEAASSARESSPKEPQVPAKSSGSVASDEQGEPTEQDDESALVEAGNTTGASGEDETKEAADEDEEPSFSALLDESDVAVDDNAAHRAQSEPANDPAEDETAEPSEPPTEDTASASPVQAAQTATDDEDLWGALLAEEGEDGSFQPEAAA
jgi:hypothetical protein